MKLKSVSRETLSMEIKGQKTLKRHVLYKTLILQRLIVHLTLKIPSDRHL